LYLAAFFLAIGLYWFGHIRHIPAQAHATSSDYRVGVNLDYITENVKKFPLWMTRVFNLAPDGSGQSRDYANSRNTILGLAFLTATVTGVGLRLRRDAESRYTVLTLLAFIAIFLAIPIYSGAYLHHIVLPLAGFSALFGIGCAEWIGLMSNRRYRLLAASCLVALLAYCTFTDAGAHVRYGEWRPVYRLNYYALNQPPLPFDRLHTGAPLVYIENRLGWSEWGYGAFGNLTRLVYLNPDIREKIVPAMSQTTVPQCTEFLQNSSAVYLTYDEQMRLRDSTAAFRQFCTSR
jgi:hypothetical protein